MLLAGGSGVDVAGEAVPNWIMAVTGFLTLCAAVAAAWFARRAAKHAGEQVAESAAQTAEAHRQVELSERQEAIAQRTLVAQADAARKQHEAALRVERRSLEARLDERIPFVIARAKPAMYSLYDRLSDNDEWSAVIDEQALELYILPSYMQMVSVQFENTSSMPARIDVVHAANGGFSQLPEGEPLVVAPGAVAKLQWERTITRETLAGNDFDTESEEWRFNVRFWVRDLALLVRDEYAFSAALPHFAPDGARMKIRPDIRPLWPAGQTIASLLPDRHYERLDSTDDGANAD